MIRWDQFVLEVLVHDRRRVFAFEWDIAGHHVVQGDAEGVDICRGADIFSPRICSGEM